MKRLCFYKLISHPGTLLIDHLKFVGNRASKLLEIKDVNFKYSKDELCNVIKVMGYSHDLGKASEHFQTYINEIIKTGTSTINSRLKSHGFISAVICYYNLKDINKELAIVTYIAIKHHHGSLRDFVNEFEIEESDIKLLKKQYDAICIYAEDIKKELGLKLPSKSEFEKLVKDELKYDLDEYNDYLGENETFEKYILYKLVFSTLIYADKEHAIFKKDNNIKYDIPESLIDDYKLKRFGKPNMNNIRNVVYDDIMSNLKECDKRVMSITLPTGTGKTYACMSVALKLKYSLNKDMKIIYCLPFTSVIDQNFQDYSNAIKEIMKVDNVTSDKILKHHYLSPKDYKKTDVYYEGDEGRFLSQNWNSQIIVTTFIQIFNTLFSNENSSLIKFNSLSNSIILLDEVQSIPYKYWSIINELFKEIAERLNIYFIFITATQPLIFEKNEIFELASNSKEYFKDCKRTKMIVHDEDMPKEEFFDFAIQLMNNNKEKNIIFIVNTIKLSQELYIEMEKEKDGRKIEYLSTSIVPIERQKRIQQIKKSKIKTIVISTQMVEAGVDIDMDIVVRDIAPLDSINQSAGRSNRENRGEYLGEVHIVKVKQGKKYLAEYVYRDPLLLSATEKVLNGKDVILEENYKEISDKYFCELKNNMGNRESKKLRKFIFELEFEAINCDFNLIESQDKVQLFIELNDEAKEVWQKYLSYKKIKDSKEKRQKLESIKIMFYNYVISVFKNKCKEYTGDAIGYISYAELKSVYDKKFGYKAIEDSCIVL